MSERLQKLRKLDGRTRRLPQAVSEFKIQCAIVEYLRRILDPQIARLTHIANQANFDYRRGAMLKKLGVEAGWPDIVLLHGGGPVFMEVKADKGQLSPAQSSFAAFCESIEADYWIVKSIDDVRKALRLSGVRTREA